MQEDPLPANTPLQRPFPSRIKHRKTASITIRLTKAEEAQLHERAAAAQLSISAYLRSCIFEAESLRAQVKEALSQMKAATTCRSSTPEDAQPKPTPNWRTRLLPHWRRPASAYRRFPTPRTADRLTARREATLTR